MFKLLDLHSYIVKEKFRLCSGYEDSAELASRFNTLRLPPPQPIPSHQPRQNQTQNIIGTCRYPRASLPATGTIHNIKRLACRRRRSRLLSGFISTACSACLLTTSVCVHDNTCCCCFGDFFLPRTPFPSAVRSCILSKLEDLSVTWPNNLERGRLLTSSVNALELFTSWSLYTPTRLSLS